MLQKYKLPFRVPLPQAALLHLFSLILLISLFGSCRITDFQSYATDDAYFSWRDLPKNDYHPLSSGVDSNSAMEISTGSAAAPEGFTRDANGNLIISSGASDLSFADYSDFYYSSRIRRFGSAAPFSSFYSPWYTDMYWYEPEPVFWGTSIYESVPWNWNYPWMFGFSYPQWFGHNHFSYFWPINPGFNWNFSGGFGHGNSSGPSTTPYIFRKRSAHPALNSTFEGFSNSGRPASGSGPATNPPTPPPSAPVPSPQKSPNAQSGASSSPKPAGRISTQRESTPANSASRFDNRKENGMIREDNPPTQIRSVPPAPATNTRRKATFGEGSRTVPRSPSTPSRSTPTYTPKPRPATPQPVPRVAPPSNRNASPAPRSSSPAPRSNSSTPVKRPR